MTSATLNIQPNNGAETTSGSNPGGTTAVAAPAVTATAQLAPLTETPAIEPETTLHYTPNANIVNGVYVPAADGFNLADISSASALSELPSGVDALVYLGYTGGDTATFKSMVAPFIGKSNVYGFYLADEPGPGFASELKAESDYIHSVDPGAKTFIVLENNGTPTSPSYSYNPANTDVDLFGLDPYPIMPQFTGGANYAVIGDAVATAEADGISQSQIVPVYQAFGAASGPYDPWTVPTAAQEETILATWGQYAPTPAFDYAYSWGTQNGDTALADDPALQAVFAAHNAGVVGHTACYTAGTHILTPTGEVLIETLLPGDLVTTASGAHRKLRWIGSGRTLVTPRNRDRATPIVVRRHALAEYVPHRDLYITRGHSLYLEGVLIPVEELVNHRSIAWVEEAQVVEYYHLELDSHDVVIAEGAAAETYRDDDNSPLFHNVALRPAIAPMPPCAPVLHEHPTVKRIWRKLSERAGRLDLTLTDDPDLHLLADGARVDGEMIEQRIWRFCLPGPVADLRIVSRSAIPSMLGFEQDQRRLGVAVRRIVLAQPGLRREVAWDCEHLGAGFHRPEPAERHRWTNGDAAFPQSLLAPLQAGATVELHVNGLLSYPVEWDAEHMRSEAA